MQVVYVCCAGLDVHKETVSVCISRCETDGKKRQQLRVYGTFIRDLLALADWLQENGVTHVAMEATGVYWRPVWAVLEGHFQQMLVNPQHIKAVPGRKTDAKDCEWIADLLQHGLLKGSFVPVASLRELRDLTRARTSLVRERAALANRIQKVLEDANIKLGNVVSDILGVSSRAMLQSFVSGETEAARLAALARGRMRSKQPELIPALEGKISDHHRFLLREYLDQGEYLERKIVVFEEEIERHLDPFAPAISLLDPVPGCHPVSLRALLAEIGTDREQFPTAKQLCSWACVCPGNQESAGRRKSGRTRQGNRWLRGLLNQMAWAAAHTKDTYFWAQFRRLRRHRGEKRALLAVAHSLLTVIWHMLKHGTAYRELGADYFDRIEPRRLERQAVARLERLGFVVTLQKKTA
jgi:transposase